MNALFKRGLWGAGIGPVVVAILALVCLGPSASAAPITFAQFLQKTPSQQPFVYTNNSSSATFNAATFDIDLIIGSGLLAILPPGTSSMQAATFTMTSSTTSPASQSGSTLTESFPTATNTIQVTLNSPINNNTNFLTVTYTGHLGGNVGASAIGLTASQNDGDTVIFSSGVIPNIGSTTQRGFSLSFSSVTPTLGFSAGNFYNSFIASGAGGDFSANLPSVPEPTALILAGTMFSAIAAFRFHLRKSRSAIA